MPSPEMRVNVRGMLPEDRGRFGDGIIATQALDNKPASITNDNALKKSGSGAWRRGSMKQTEEIIFEVTSLNLIDEKISLTAPRPKHARPVDIIFSFNGEQRIERDFASLIYSSSSRSLAPVVESIRWKSLLLVFGRHSCLIFDRNAGRLIDTITLHRREGEDTGFYKIEFQDLDDILAIVYESGIFAIATTGSLWHEQKSWDDQVVSIDDHGIVVATASGDRYTLDSRTGRVH